MKITILRNPAKSLGLPADYREGKTVECDNKRAEELIKARIAEPADAKAKPAAKPAESKPTAKPAEDKNKPSK